MRWNGGAWNLVLSPTDTLALRSLDMVSADDGWAVGFDLSQYEDGTMLHWNGDTWNPVVALRDVLVYLVAMLSAEEGWVVGDAGIILRWNGSTWRQVPNPALYRHSLYSVTIASADNGWAVGITAPSCPGTAASGMSAKPNE